MDSEIVELRRQADGLGRNAPAMFAGAVRPVLSLVSGLLDVVERQGREIESLKSERAANGDG